MLNVVGLAKKLDFIIEPMQKHFSEKPGAYYNHPLFFLSVAMHRLLPKSVDRAIMLDADLKFLGDIAQLYKHFDEFDDTNVIGIAHDAQPVSHFLCIFFLKFGCILPRYAMLARDIPSSCVFVSHAGIVSKRLNVGSRR